MRTQTASSARDPILRVRVLGAPEITLAAGGRPVITQPRRVALLVYLLIAEPRGPHSRDVLATLLWEERDAHQARQALRNALHGIRRAVGSDVVRTTGHDLIAIDSDAVECDLLALEGALGAGRASEGLTRYAEPLAGFHVSAAPQFERWLDGMRASLRSRVLQSAAEASDTLVGAGDRREALALLSRARALDPEHEPLVRRYLTVCAEEGEVAEALRVYRELEARLQREYGSEPAPSTRAVADGIARHAGRLAHPGGTTIPDPYVLCVRATFLFLRAMHLGGRVDELDQSRALFEQVLARDPRSAPALAGLSNYYAAGAARNHLRPFREHFDRALALGRQALQIDERLAIPHVHFGTEAMYLESDWPRARSAFERAVELDPSYAEARRFLGVCLGALGQHDDAVRELQQAVRTEPNIPSMRNSLADALLAAGRVDDAIDELQATLAIEPNFRAARERLIRGFERSFRYAEAIRERQVMGPPDAAARFALAFEEAGPDGYRRERERELRTMMTTLAERALAPGEDAGDLFNPPELRLALAHAELAEWPAALLWEERAAARRPGLRQWFIGRHELAPLAPSRPANRLAPA